MTHQDSTSTEHQAEVAQDIKKLLNRFNTWATQLQFATVLITLSSILPSLAIGFFADQLGTKYLWVIKVLAFIAASSTALLSGLKLEKKARDLRDAYRYLQYEMYKYKLGTNTIEDLIDAYAQAEKLVGHVELDVESIPQLAKALKKRSN